MYRRLAVACACLALYACEDHKSDVKAPSSVKAPPSPQAACAEAVTRKYLEVMPDIVSLRAKAMQQQTSLIALELQQRRLDEQMCLESARCYDTEEPMLSWWFTACLHDTERSED
jgi:hypothetical protein